MYLMCNVPSSIVIIGEKSLEITLLTNIKIDTLWHSHTLPYGRGGEWTDLPMCINMDESQK